MFATITPHLSAAAMARVTLLLNHVLASEAMAVTRLKPHAGRTVRLAVVGWPSLLPPVPTMVFAITPAGLLEWCGAAASEADTHAPDLKVSVTATNPARLVVQWLQSERPQVDIEGDAALASDVGWLIENLRWDIEDDLAKLIGPAPAHQLSKIARWIAQGFTSAVRSLQGLVKQTP